MTLGSTQPLTEMSTMRISWGKDGWCVRLITLPPSRAVVMKSGNLNFLQPSGPLQVCNGTAYLSVGFIIRKTWVFGRARGSCTECAVCHVNCGLIVAEKCLLSLPYTSEGTERNTHIS